MIRRLPLLAFVLGVCEAIAFPGRGLATPSQEDTLYMGPHAHVHVVDSRGHALAGAYVTFACMPKPKDGPDALGRDALGIVGPSETTDGTGWALLFRCSDDADVTLEASAPGFAPRQMHFDHADSIYEISLVRGASLRGRLLREGHPLANTPVALLRVRGSARPNILDGQDTTDAHGRYTFRGLTPEVPYWIYVPLSAATKFGTVRAESIRTGKDGSVVEAPDLHANSGHTLSGRIVMPSGSSLVGQYIQLRLVRWIGYEADAIKAAVDTNGVFEFRGVPEERMRIAPVVKGFGLGNQLEAPLEYFEDGSALITVRGDHRNLKLPMYFARTRGD